MHDRSIYDCKGYICTLYSMNEVINNMYYVLWIYTLK